MTSETWYKSNFPNIQFKKHPSRKHGVKYDQYFRASYQVAMKRKAFNFGWASEGWTDSQVWEKLNKYRKNAKTGYGPTTLKEEREIEESKNTERAYQKALKDKENISFSDFWGKHYKPHAERKKNWAAEKSFHRTWIKKVIGTKSLKDITIFDLEKLQTIMEKAGRAPKTIQLVLATIRQVFNRAINTDMFPGPNPVSKIKFKRLNNNRSRYLTKEESKDLLQALKKKSEQVHNIALLSLHTGMRASEVFKLAWRNIDFDQGTIHIIDSKNTESRYAYMSKPIKRMLANLLKTQEASLIFPDKKGNQIRTISKTYSRVVEDLGFNNDINDDREKVVFHTLRHTFASWQVQAGMDLYTLQKLMGHKSFQMVQRYAHLAPDNLKKATSIFNRLDKDKNNVIPFPKKA